MAKQKTTINNIGFRRFCISYDIKPRDGFTNENMRESFVNMLLDHGCTSIKSYTESTILFSSTDFKTFLFWFDKLHENFHQLMSFNFCEIAKFDYKRGEIINKGDFKSAIGEESTREMTHSARFEELVNRLRDERITR